MGDENRRGLPRIVTGLVFGQVLSLLITGTGIFSTILADTYHVEVPTTQSFLNYFLLSLFCLVLWRKGTLKQTLQDRYGWYLLFAFIDVEANYLVVKAYQYTTITSVMLLDCFTIPSSVVLSYYFLGTYFTITQLLGSAICIGGLVTLVVADIAIANNEDGSEPANVISGDLFVLAGSFLYACSNVGQEYTVRQRSRIEYLACIGLFGTLLSGFQLGILEHSELSTMDWSRNVLLLMGGFAICLYLMYVFTPTMMLHSSAVVFNLSLLTSDFYSAIAAVLLFDQKFSLLYIAAFSITIIGLILYHVPSRKVGQPQIQRIGEEEEEEDNGESGEGADVADESVPSLRYSAREGRIP